MNSVSAPSLGSYPQTPPSHEKRGLVTIKRFLGCADSAFLFLRKPIRLQVSVLVS